MTKQEVLDLIQSQLPALSVATVSGNTFAHVAGRIQKWTITSDAALSITGLSGGVPAMGVVYVIQGTGGGYIPTLGGFQEDVIWRLEEDDVNVLGFIWDGTSLHWSSSFSVVTEYEGYESEAKAFFAVNTGLNTTQKDAVNQLILDLKEANLWSRMKAIYPVVGGTADAHKWNLINPADSNAAFRIVWNGTVSHSGTGFTPNGTNGYGNTFFNVSDARNGGAPFTNFTDPDKFHVSYYSRTNTAPGSGDYALFGAARSSFNLLFEFYNVSRYFAYLGEATTNITLTSQTEFDGFFVASRTSATSAKAFRNASQLGDEQIYTLDQGSNPATHLYLGASNASGTANYFSSYECAFASIGDELSDAEVTALTTIVDTYQTALSRNV